MRNFDNWTSYRDLKGNILRGCVQFNVKGGNTPAPIFDRNGTAIANPQITDILGRTQHQVFIDEDVTAYFYKYVGDVTIAEEEAQGIDTSDVSRWALQFTCDNVLAFGASFDSLSAMEIGTMSGLRAIDPESVPNVGGVKAVILGGYYEAGDCEQVRYIWDSDSTEADDNGSVIKCNDLLTGRWILVRPDGFVDSRHFGVFPQYSQLADIDHTTRITQLVNYCNAAGLNPLFGGSVSNPYFIYNSLNVNSRNAISVSKDTAFVDKSDSNFFGDWSGNPLFVNGNTKVSAHTVRASWNFSDAVAYNEVWLDSPCQKTAFEKARVIVTYDTAGKTFDHCELVSDGHLADNTFHDCVLRGSMFIGQSLSPTIDDNCTVQPLDFVDRMDLWCKLRRQQHNPIVDCCMQTLDASCELSLDGIWIKNALFDGFQHESAVSIGFESCRGSVEIVCNGNTAITSEDSELILTLTNTGEVGVGLQPEMTVHGGSICLAGTLGYFVAKDSDLSGSGIIVNGPCSLINCQTSLPITVRGALNCTNSTINANVNHYTVSTPAFVRMQGCTLNAYYSLNPAVANSTVDAVWANNYSSVESPILIDRTNIDTIDSHHTYVYSDNSGGFLPYCTRKIHEITIHHANILVNWATAWLTDPYTLIQSTNGSTSSSGKYCWFGKMIPHYDMQHHFDTVEMFRIGTDRFRINARLTDIDSTLMDGGGIAYEYAMNMPVEAGLGAYFVSGNTFCIRPWFDDPTEASENLTYNNVSPVIMKGSRSFGSSESPSFTDYHVTLGIEYECMDKHGR